MSSAPTSRRSAALAARPPRYARVRPSAVTRRASTSSSASGASRSPSDARSGSDSSKTPSTYASAAPRTHDPGPRAPAEQQVEGVREHRLARSGLTREHREAGAEPQLGPLDEQEVLDTQLDQHARGSTNEPRRIRGRTARLTQIRRRA